MTKLYEITPEWCDSFPKPHAPVVLYTRTMEVALHACPCGCGKDVVTPLDSGAQPGWSLRVADDRVTLTPSVHCTGFECRSHYFIRDNKIEWC